MLSEMASDIDRARLHSYAGVAVGAWLIASPTWHAFYMPSFIFSTTLRICLGLPHPTLLGHSSCACGAALDPQDIHVLHCATGPERTATHDAIRDVVASICRDAGYHVTMETRGILPPRSLAPNARQVDIVFSRAGMRSLGDVIIADPT